MKLSTNFFYVAGYAGHGKDTAKNIAKENYENTFFEISMAETLKVNACSIITDEFREIIKSDKDIDVLNGLKDNYPDLEFYAGMNTRTFLQKIGTEFYRSLNDSIHTTFVASKILDGLLANKDNNVVFTSCDIRFPNELEFMLKMSQLKDDDLVDYLRYLQKTVANTLPDNEKIAAHFEKVFNVDRSDKRAGIIIDSILHSTDKLKSVGDYNKEWTIQTPDTSKMSKEQAIEYGLIHIFRPILNPKFVYEKDLKPQQIVEEIKKYTGLEYGRIADVMKYYKVSTIDFTVENVLKYGFLRADIRHPSENAINHMKPEAILSTPLRDSKFSEELLTLLSHITVKDDLKQEAKKKNLNNRGIQ